MFVVGNEAPSHIMLRFKINNITSYVKRSIILEFLREIHGFEPDINILIHASGREQACWLAFWLPAAGYQGFKAT